MSSPSPPPPPNTTSPFEEHFPGIGFPTVFADGVLNTSISPSVARFYLFRFEPSFGGNNAYRQTPVAQVAMTVDGFIAAALFLERQLAQMVQSGLVTQQRVDEAKKMLGF